MTNKITLTGLMIVKNEVHHIEEAIKSLSFCDEIVVVDGFSTDGTFEKLKSYSQVTVLQHKFKNFTDQRNFSLKQATKDWILILDADERITKALREEILATITNPKGVNGFMIRRQHYFDKKPIRFSGFQTDTTYRLFKNGCVIYDENKLVHEMPIVSGKSAILKEKMPHYSIASTKNFKAKMEQYAFLKAKELHQKGKKTTLWHLTIRPFFKFFFNYFIRLGILDGKEGFQICYLQAYGVYYRYKQLQKINLST